MLLFFIKLNSQLKLLLLFVCLFSCLDFFFSSGFLLKSQIGYISYCIGTGSICHLVS